MDVMFGNVAATVAACCRRRNCYDRVSQQRVIVDVIVVVDVMTPATGQRSLMRNVFDTYVTVAKTKRTRIILQFDDVNSSI